ncbi:MAG: hypothetical protein RL536_252 [Candidatus Parcubacteria bacterium]|jgi:hypothetical protein
MRDYQLISPSLDGILHHDSIVYEGIRRPFELLRVMDAPVRRKAQLDKDIEEVVYTKDQKKIIQDYLQDLHTLFLKKFSQFMAESELKPDEGVKLLAMLQEMIKIKRLTNV